MDVWSLGGIFSEAATWVGHGWERVIQYRSARKQEVAKKLVNPEDDGDLFHDGSEALDAVADSHDSVINSLRKDDFITEKIIKDVIGNMMEHHRVRYDAFQAHNKATKALRHAREQHQAYKGGTTVSNIAQNLGSLNISTMTASPSSVFPTTPQSASLPTQSEEPAPSSDPAITANGGTTPILVSSNGMSRPPPRISVESVLQWRTGIKMSIPKLLPNQGLLDGIKDRDSVSFTEKSIQARLIYN